MLCILSRSIGRQLIDMKLSFRPTGCALLITIVGLGCKPVLNQKTAERLIPNGMSEAEVYKILGTNGLDSSGRNGEKIVHYFFPFTGQPPKIKNDLPAMTVVFSNGLVISKQYPEFH